MITISDGILTIPECERFVGFTGDNNHTRKTFYIQNNTQSGWLYRLYLTFDDGRHNFFILPASVSSEGTWLTWDIDESHIVKSGLVKAQIKAFSEENEVYHTSSDIFVAGLSSEEADNFKNGNSEFLLYEKTLNELYRKMQTASAKMPYVGENGNWYVYSTETDAYVDSGVSSSSGLADNSVTPGKLDRRYWEKTASLSNRISDCDVLFNTIGFVNTGGSIAFVNVKLFVADMDTTIDGFCYGIGVKFDSFDTVYLINVSDGTSWKITRTNTGDEYITIYTYTYEKNNFHFEINDGSVTPKKLDRSYWEKKIPVETQIIYAEDLFEKVGFINSGGSIAFVNVNVKFNSGDDTVELETISGFCYAIALKFEDVETLYLVNVSDGNMWKINRYNEGDEFVPLYSYEYIKQGIDVDRIPEGSIGDEKLSRNYWRRLGSVPIVGNDLVLASMLADEVVPIIGFTDEFHPDMGVGPFVSYPNGNNIYSLINLVNCEIWQVVKEESGLLIELVYSPVKVDKELSSTSVNAVQNKLVTEALGKRLKTENFLISSADIDVLSRLTDDNYIGIVRGTGTYIPSYKYESWLDIISGNITQYRTFLSTDIRETRKLIYADGAYGLGEWITDSYSKSAYDIAKENGFEGTEVDWINSLKGTDGADGQDGYTPVKGIDYYTDVEQAEFESLIVEEIAKRNQLAPEFANDISDCIDTSKMYVLPDGYVYAYMLSNNGQEAEFSNLLKQDECALDVRLNSSGSTTALEGYFVTNYIDISNSDLGKLLRFRNITLMQSQATFALYDDSRQMIGVYYTTADDVMSDENGDSYIIIGQNNSTSISSSVTDAMKYIRFCFSLPADGIESAVITLDEEISYKQTNNYSWMSTNHAFVPADYENRIVALEKAIMGDLSIYGVVDDDNNIVMSGSLDAGTYTLKYQNEDGSVTDIGSFDV